MEAGEKYCSDHCRDAGSAEVEIACECGHATCSTSIEHVASSERYEFSKKRLIAVGYSNGANIAASLILLHPHYLTAAVLFRAMVSEREIGLEMRRDPFAIH